MPTESGQSALQIYGTGREQNTNNRPALFQRQWNTGSVLNGAISAPFSSTHFVMSLFHKLLLLNLLPMAAGGVAILAAGLMVDAHTLEHFSLFILTTLACIILLGIATTMFMQQVLMKPFGRLLEAQKRLAEGDMTARIKTGSSNELGELEASFNQMASAIQQTQEKLQESEALFRSQFELGNIGIAITGPDRRWLHANWRLTEMLGYSEESLKAKRWDEITHPDDLQTDVDQYHRMLDGEINAYELDKRYVCKDGHFIEVHITTSCVRNVDRSLRYVIVSVQDITASRQAEAERARLIAILESTTDVVAIALPSGQVHYLNAAGFSMTGYNIHEPVSHHSIQDFHPPQTYKMLQDVAIPTAIRTGIWHGESLILSHDHKEVSVSQLVMAHRSPSGELQYLSTIMRDITSTKQAQKEALERENTLRRHNEAVVSLMQNGNLFQSDFKQAIRNIEEACASLVQAERVSVWWYTEDFKLLRCVDLFERTPGRHSGGQELVSADFPSYTRSHQRGMVISCSDVYTDERTREIPRSYYEESRIFSLIDAPIWLQNRIGGVFSIEHVGEKRIWTQEEERLAETMATLISLCFEISQRKQTETALRESEERFRTIFENAPVGIITMDQEGRFLDVNNTACELNNVKREQIVGRFPTDSPELYRIKEPEKAAELRGKLAIQGFLRNEEVTMFRPLDNKQQNIMFSSRFITIGGKPIIISMSTDITERKRLEDQLRQAQKMEAIGHLAGGIAHDFNNLLQAILGYTDLVYNSLRPDDPNRADLKEVRLSAERAASLTRQLLAFSRRQVLQLTPLDLNGIIDDMINMIIRLIGEHIQIKLQHGQNLACIMADRGQIEQVVLNLCINARDAMPQGGALTIETSNAVLDTQYGMSHPQARPGQYVHLSVSDNGIGMDAATLEQIFEPFFSTKEKGKGTGLGLATVHGIILQHKGFIQVSSEPGKGSRFNIYLPACEKTEENVESVTQATARGGTETILLAEDDEGIRRLTQRLLRKAGYQVLAAADGAEALRLYAGHQGPIHMLLLDVVMPYKGGRAVYDEIRATHPDARVLFTSGYSEATLQTNFILDAGINLLTKPYQHEALLRAVRRVLDA